MEISRPEVHPDDLLSPEELKEKYSKEIADYFDLEPEHAIKLVVFNSMQEIGAAFREYAGLEPPAYLKGFVPGGSSKRNEVWLVKSGVPDEHGRIMSRDYLNRSLKHEVVHIYQKVFFRENEIDGRNIPIWLVEGMALCLAGQQQRDPGEITEERLKGLDVLGSDKFDVGKKMVSEIMERYGKEKLLELFAMQDQDKLYAKLKRMFDWLK